MYLSKYLSYYNVFVTVIVFLSKYLSYYNIRTPFPWSCNILFVLFFFKFLTFKWLKTNLLKYNYVCLYHMVNGKLHVVVVPILLVIGSTWFFPLLINFLGYIWLERELFNFVKTISLDKLLRLYLENSKHRSNSHQKDSNSKKFERKTNYHNQLERDGDFRYANKQLSQKNPRNWGKPPRIDKLFDSRFEKMICEWN